jgi:hypothetical protein
MLQRLTDFTAEKEIESPFTVFEIQVWAQEYLRQDQKSKVVWNLEL